MISPQHIINFSYLYVKSKHVNKKDLYGKAGDSLIIPIIMGYWRTLISNLSGMWRKARCLILCHLGEESTVLLFRACFEVRSRMRPGWVRWDNWKWDTPKSRWKRVEERRRYIFCDVAMGYNLSLLSSLWVVSGDRIFWFFFW